MHICIDSTYIVFAIRKSFHSESLSICILRVTEYNDINYFLCDT
jgi:hypothetical protein